MPAGRFESTDGISKVVAFFASPETALVRTRAIDGALKNLTPLHATRAEKAERPLRIASSRQRRQFSSSW
jgi:hypothetical protein